MPDSRLERESRSAIEGDSVRSEEMGEVSWPVLLFSGGMRLEKEEEVPCDISLH